MISDAEQALALARQFEELGYKEAHVINARQIAALLRRLAAKEEAPRNTDSPAVREGMETLDTAYIEKLIDEYVEGYDFRGDNGDYTPSPSDRFMIKDAIMGLTADPAFLAALVPTPKLSEPTGSLISDLIDAVADWTRPKRSNTLNAARYEKVMAIERRLRHAVHALTTPNAEPVACLATRLWNARDTWTCPADIEAALTPPAAQPSDDPVERDVKRASRSLASVITKIENVPAAQPKPAEVYPVEVWRGDRKVTIYPRENVLRVHESKAAPVTDEPFSLDAVQSALDWLYDIPADPMDTPLPCKVDLGGVSMNKGVKLSSLVYAARRWREAAYGPQPSQEEADRNLAALQGKCPMCRGVGSYGEPPAKCEFCSSKVLNPYRNAELYGAAPEPKEVVIHCKEKLKPGGCQLHNLHCGWPKCNTPK